MVYREKTNLQEGVSIYAKQSGSNPGFIEFVPGFTQS
jgi:hypothetical protein